MLSLGLGLNLPPPDPFLDRVLDLHITKGTKPEAKVSPKTKDIWFISCLCINLYFKRLYESFDNKLVH